MAQERRSSRTPADRSGDGQSSRRSNDRRRRSRSFAASSGMLYAVAVIGVSILLACVCWIAANDVLALKDGTVYADGPSETTITPALIEALYQIPAAVWEKDGRKEP